MKPMRLWLLTVIMAVLLAGCGGSGGTTATDPGSNPKPDEAGTDQGTKTEEAVTLKMFTAYADRANGPGKIEQEIIDAYMQENPNVKIEVEALQDEPYKAKIKVYASTNQLPDIIQAWGQPSFLSPLLDNDMLLELNPADFDGSHFVTGSVDGFSKDGKMYGIPRNTDYAVLYYNKKIFDDNGLKVPTTVSELLDVVKQLRAKDINPVAINGMEGWTLPIMFDYYAQRASGDFTLMDKAFNGEISFTDPGIIQGATDMLAFAEAKGFADGWLTADYGTARNLFGQGQAAMFFMGNWEASLATDENFSEEFRQNVGAISFPASDKGAQTDIAAWYGGGYAISKNTKHADAAIAFMKYFFTPDNWPRKVWQSGAGTPAQKFDPYLTGEETELQKQLIDIFTNMTSSAGTPLQDISSDEFKQKSMEIHQQLLSGKITPEQFAKDLDAAAAKANGK